MTFSGTKIDEKSKKKGSKNLGLTVCVELKYSDGTVISIDTIAVENEVADNMVQRSELDWLIYNKPFEYAQLVLDEDL